HNAVPYNCYKCCFFFSSRRRHTRSKRDWSSDVCSSDLEGALRGFSEEETTMGVARYAPFSAMAILIGAQAGRPGVLTQCSAEERSEERRVGKECSAGWAACSEDRSTTTSRRACRSKEVG